MAYYFIEVTDTINGKANYSWTEKYCVEATEANVMRRVKRELGWNGVRCDRKVCGDKVQLKPRGGDVVAVIQRETDNKLTKSM
jgi:hypothetical protein